MSARPVLSANHLLRLLHLDHETIGIAGGVILFLIALRTDLSAEKHAGGELLEGSRSWCRWPCR